MSWASPQTTNGSHNPDHGRSRSRLGQAYSRIMTTIALALVCNLEFWIWLIQWVFFTIFYSYTFTPHLIMGQMFYGTDPWPTWPINICWPIWPMTRWVDQLSALGDRQTQHVARPLVRSANNISLAVAAWFTIILTRSSANTEEDKCDGYVT